MDGNLIDFLCELRFSLAIRVFLLYLSAILGFLIYFRDYSLSFKRFFIKIYENIR